MVQIIKERPILFSGAMVQALKAGTKTQTRRAIKNQPPPYAGNVICERFNPAGFDKNGEMRPGPEVFGAYDDAGYWGAVCPYGQPGDRLWVREHMIKNLNTGTYWPAADGYTRSISEETGKPFPHEKSVPSIHMPRAASRLLLEITAVRVERLQDISEADAVAEGIEPVMCPTTGTVPAKKWKNYQGRAYCDGMNLNHPSESYRTLWASINGPESWAANPWVWVVEFKIA